jgi:hypothetical protein
MGLTFSNSHLWTKCQQACSPRTADMLPAKTETTTELQREGTAAEWLARTVLAGELTAEELIGRQAPNGVVIDAVMARHIEGYIEVVSRHGKPRVEVEASLFGGLVNGRVDGVSTEAEDVLHIYDLKYGYRIVEPHTNSQLLLGALHFAKPHHRIISMEIYQPRAFHPGGIHRKWVIDMAELLRWGNELQERAKHIAAADRPIAVPGKYCGDCPRASGCSTLLMNNYEAFELVSANFKHATPRTVTELGALGDWLEVAAEMIDAKRKGIRAEIEATIESGSPVPGWVVDVAAEGKREWLVGAAHRRLALGIDPFKRVELSPAEMEKAGADPKLVKEITQKGRPGRRLMQFATSAVAAVFGPPVGSN